MLDKKIKKWARSTFFNPEQRTFVDIREIPYVTSLRNITIVRSTHRASLHVRFQVQRFPMNREFSNKTITESFETGSISMTASSCLWCCQHLQRLDLNFEVKKVKFGWTRHFLQSRTPFSMDVLALCFGLLGLLLVAGLLLLVFIMLKLPRLPAEIDSRRATQIFLIQTGLFALLVSTRPSLAKSK